MRATAVVATQRILFCKRVIVGKVGLILGHADWLFE